MVRLSALVQSPVLGSQLQRDTDVLERFQQKSMMILEGLGARECVETVKELALFRLEERKLREILSVCINISLDEERRQTLHSRAQA